MEGKLLKWTNYYNGWQPRYFRLDEHGVLSYYLSKDLISQGCKGSCLVEACQLKVHAHDPCRFDVIIPGEQFFSLKAKSQKERQQWLLALGTLISKGTKSTYSKNRSVERKTSNVCPTANSDQELKIKIQELRLYETALMQGIHSIKSVVNDAPTIDVEKLDQSASMLSVTCDAFIRTMDECMKLSHGNSSSLITNTSSTIVKNENLSQEKIHPIESISVLEKSERIPYRTFFSELPNKFFQFESLEIHQIDTEVFLSTCEQYFTIFEKFSSPTFIPLRTDIQNHISRIRRKLSNNTDKFHYFTLIIEDELSSQSNREKNSATDAIIWLKRDLDFLASFFHTFGHEVHTVEDSLNRAYGETLKTHHGWATRGIFSIAFRSSPYEDDFLQYLMVDSQNEIDEQSFKEQICHEMIEHADCLRKIINKMTEFFAEHELESNSIVFR